MPDGTEVLINETDPFDPSDDLSGDTDGDGVSDEDEGGAGTDLSTMDSDGDTISDADEIGVDLDNPLDTDGDGLIDALDSDSMKMELDAVEAGDTDLATPPVDSDSDRRADYRDTDSDNGVDDGPR